MVLVWLAGSVAGAVYLIWQAPRLYRRAKYEVSVRQMLMRFSQACRRQELLMQSFVYPPVPSWARERERK